MTPEERIVGKRAALAKWRASSKGEKYYADNKERIRARNRERYAERRLEVLKHYGGDPPKCACCGESTYEFLSIDHIDGGGTAHKSKVGKGTVYWNSFIKAGYPVGMQVLCHNCNQAKGYYGECPHQRKQLNSSKGESQ